MKLKDDPSAYWLKEAQRSLKQGKTYSAIREFIGSINRATTDEDNVKPLKTINFVVNHLIETEKIDVLYAVLRECLPNFKKIKRIDLVEETLLMSYKAIERLDNKCEKLLNFLNFVKQYNVNFVIDEAEILALHCDDKVREIFDLIIPLVIQTETYDVAKNVLQDETLQQEPKYRCYQLLLEILLGAPEQKIIDLIEYLAKQEQTSLVRGTIYVVRSIIDLEVHLPPLDIAKETEIDDEIFFMLTKKIQELHYY